MKMNITIKLTALLTLLMFAAIAYAGPNGYSVSSDSGNNDAFNLYRIDLATGQQTKLGLVQSFGQPRIDVEGLAFAPDGTLYGMDDNSLRLFPINIDNGTVDSTRDVTLSGLPTGGNNDFGMTFACDGNLYASSVNTDMLYRVNLNGTTTQLGSLGANISALAAFGNPVKLYGLGNGLTKAGAVDSRTLYSINPQTGATTAIGQLGAAAGHYTEAGLAFDSSGVLWAITDRGLFDLGMGGPFPSQILRIDTATGVATAVANTTQVGFESLAITIPRGCGGTGSEKAQFTVQKRFVDYNNHAPVTLMLSCNTGLPLEQSKTVQPNEGVNGEFEVKFVVESFDSGELACQVTEQAPPGYTPTYVCLGESDCTVPQGPDSCAFINVEAGSDNLCQVQNYPSAVPLTVHKQWLLDPADIGFSGDARITVECENVFDGDGLRDGNDMSWLFDTSGDASVMATIYPDFDGSTRCRAEESQVFSAVEPDNGCSSWIPLNIGDAPKSCTITNTVFLEGIPTLGDYAKLMFALLMLATGLVAVRRY